MNGWPSGLSQAPWCLLGPHLSREEGAGAGQPLAHSGAVGQRLSAPEKGSTVCSGLRPSKK